MDKIEGRHGGYWYEWWRNGEGLPRVSFAEWVGELNIRRGEVSNG